jgi:hypothetical protein
MTVHELRQSVHRRRRAAASRAPLVVTILSFGFKHGLPLDADLVFDVRFLPNPHFVPALRPKTGRDRAVVRLHANAADATRRVPEALNRCCASSSRSTSQEGKSYLTVGDRLHRRAAPLGRDGRGAQARVEGVTRAHRDIARGPGTSGKGERQHMIGVVVVTHGQLATELVNAAETIVGDLPQFAAVSIGWHDDVDRTPRGDRARPSPACRALEGRAARHRHVRRHAVEPGLTFLEPDRRSRS